MEQTTHAKQIFQAVAKLVKEGKEVFSRKDVRDKLGLRPYEWQQSYTSIFQSMRCDPKGAPSVVETFKGVFKNISHGKFILTDKGKQLVNS